MNRFCSVCLVINTRLHAFAGSKYKTFITNFFKQRCYSQLLNQDDYIDICFECQAYLKKSFDFIERALRAQVLLKQMMAQEKSLDTFKVITKINSILKLKNYANLCIKQQCLTHVFTENNRGFVEEEKFENYFVATHKVKYFGGVKKGPKSNAVGKGVGIKLEVDEDIDIEENIIEGAKDNIGSEVIKLEPESECELEHDNTRTPQNDPLSTKSVSKRWLGYNQSEFILSLSSIPAKRPRKEVRYDENVKKGSMKKSDEHDSEYEPQSDESTESDGSLDLYTKTGRRMMDKEKDYRVFPMKCDHCDAIIYDKRSHYWHYLEMHRGVDYPYTVKRETWLCELCGYTAYKKHNYVQHMLSKHGAAVRCDACGKSFRCRAYLQRHRVLAHSLAARYECDYCRKTFISKGDLRLHIRIHTGDKPYKCHICGAGFAHGGNVAIHIRDNHQNEPKRKHAPNTGKNKTKTDKNGPKTGKNVPKIGKTGIKTGKNRLITGKKRRKRGTKRENRKTEETSNEETE